MSITVDYRSFTPDGPPQKQASTRWWTLKHSELPAAIDSVVTTLQQAQTQLDTQRAVCARLYGNSPIFGIHGMNYAKLPANPTIRDRITYNLVQSVVDTVQAKIAKNKPKPLILTQKGNYKLQRKAQKLNQFIDGVFFHNRMRELGPLSFRDACIMGTAPLHVFSKDNMVRFERLLVSELVVDELEALYGVPRQIHRVKTVDRQVLAEMFSDHRKAIEEANSSVEKTHPSRLHVADQVAVIESWHLPSGKDAGDGLHTICISSKPLLVEKWERDCFPFAFLHWNKKQYGFWGQSLAEQLQNIQLEINKILWIIQRSMHLMGSWKVLMENGSKIVKEHINNDIGTIVNYTGVPPQYVTPPVVQPELYQHLTTLIQRGYEQAGISMLSATAQKPAGLDSGKALREYNDIETERFMIVGEAYQQYHLDLAHLAILEARELYERTKKVKVQVPGRKFIETIDWKEVDMDEDQYVMQSYPISSLPNEPAGRLQTIQEYMQAGFLDPRQGRRLLDFPDLDQVEGLANASEERILATLDKIVDEGVYTPPDQYYDLQAARELALQYYNQFANQDLEEERLDLLRNFMTQIDDLLAKMSQPEAPAAPLPGEMPMAPEPGMESPAAMPGGPPPMPPNIM